MLWRERDIPSAAGMSRVPSVAGPHVVAAAQGRNASPRAKLLGLLLSCEGRVPGRHASPQGSWTQAVTLLAELGCPGSQEDMGETVGHPLTVWGQTLSLGLGLQWPLAFQLWLMCACFSASGTIGDSRLDPFWYLLGGDSVSVPGVRVWH